MNAQILFDGAIDGDTPYTDEVPISRQTIGVSSPVKDFHIESVDDLGRPLFRSVPRESLLNHGGGDCKWKRKSEIQNSAALLGKQRISINAFNYSSEILSPVQQARPEANADPFQLQSQGSEVISSFQPVPGEGRPSTSLVKLGTTTQDRLSRISQLMIKRASKVNGALANTDEIGPNLDFSQILEEDNDDEPFCPAEEIKSKLSIRSITTNQHVLHMQQPYTILQRASLLLLSNRLKAFNHPREKQVEQEETDLADDEEEGENQIDDNRAHHCSQLSRYQLPTTFMASQTRPMTMVAQTPQVKSAKSRLEGKPGLVSASVELQGSRRMLMLTPNEPPQQEDVEDDVTEELPKLLKEASEVTEANFMFNHGSSLVEGVNLSPDRDHASSKQCSFIEYSINPMSSIVSSSALGGRLTQNNLPTEEVKVSIIEEEILNMMEEVKEDGKQQKSSKLEGLITKVQETAQVQTTAELHREHYYQTLQILEHIRRDFSAPPSTRVLEERFGSLIDLPEPWEPLTQRKVAVFDMDETLIHCVDDIENESPDVVLEIDFGQQGNPEDIVCAGINIRPYWRECLEEASKNFQVIVFTASNQMYADAILNYLDPDNQLIQYRMYRQHCFLTPENYYVKDLRIIGNRPMKDIVLVDNSVYSFAYQLSNGVPIVPFYRQPPQDEEMLHLIYYLSCLAQVDDVRVQNMQAFELHKLGIQQDPESTYQTSQQSQMGEIKEEVNEDDQ